MAKKLVALLGGGVVAGITAYFLQSGSGTNSQGIENMLEAETSHVQSKRKVPLTIVTEPNKNDVNLAPNDMDDSLVDDAFIDRETQEWIDYHQNSDAIYQELEERLKLAKKGDYLEQEIYNEIISADPVIKLHTLIDYMQKNNIDDAFINAVDDVISTAENIDVRILQDVQRILNDVKDMRSYTGTQAIESVVMTPVFEHIKKSYFQEMRERSEGDLSENNDHLSDPLADFDHVPISSNADTRANLTVDEIRREQIDLIYDLYQDGFDFSDYPEFSEAISLSGRADSYLESLHNRISTFPDYRSSDRDKNTSDLDIEFGF